MLGRELTQLEALTDEAREQRDPVPGRANDGAHTGSVAPALCVTVIWPRRSTCRNPRPGSAAKRVTPHNGPLWNNCALTRKPAALALTDRTGVLDGDEPVCAMSDRRIVKPCVSMGVGCRSRLLRTRPTLAG